MSEMVERVAKAIFADHQLDGEPAYPIWEETGAREEYRNAARIALRAMREPTPAMFEAFISAARMQLGGELLPTAFDDFKSDYAAMIDAALSEGLPMSSQDRPTSHAQNISKDAADTTSP